MMYNTRADTSRALCLSTYYMTFCLDQRIVFIFLKLLVCCCYRLHLFMFYAKPPNPSFICYIHVFGAAQSA